MESDKKNVRERLDRIVIDSEGLIFSSWLIDGWKVYSSSTGLKFATLDIDYNVTWSSGTQFYLGGKMATSSVSENVPNNFFTTVMLCYVSAYSYIAGTIEKVRIKPISKSMYSNTYTGDWDMVACQTDDAFDLLPPKIHVIYTMIGF